jgi:hypothetical protein
MKMVEFERFFVYEFGEFELNSVIIIIIIIILIIMRRLEYALVVIVDFLRELVYLARLIRQLRVKAREGVT